MCCPRDQLAESQQAIRGQQRLNGSKDRRDLFAPLENLLASHALGLLLLSDTGQCEFSGLNARYVFGVSARIYQLVRTAIEEGEQIFEEPTWIGRAQKTGERQVGDSLAQKCPQLELIEKLEIFSRLSQQLIAITVKRRGVQP